MFPFAIRPAVADDLPGLLTLYRQLSPKSPPLDDATARATWRELLDDPKVHVLVADADETLVGTLTVVVVPNLTQGARPYALIENVVTHESWRGQGIGRALMAAALDLAREGRAYKAMLVTGRRAPEVHRLYAGSGLRSDATAYFIRLNEG